LPRKAGAASAQRSMRCCRSAPAGWVHSEGVLVAVWSCSATTTLAANHARRRSTPAPARPTAVAGRDPRRMGAGWARSTNAGRNSARFAVSGQYLAAVLSRCSSEATTKPRCCTVGAAHGHTDAASPRGRAGRGCCGRRPRCWKPSVAKKSAAAARLGDAQSDVAAAHDVEGRIEGVLGKRASAWTPKDQGLTGQAAAAVWRAMVGPHTHCGRGS